MEQATSIDKALDVLFYLHAERVPVGVTALGDALGMAKSSAHRLLSALSRRGLVERDGNGRYRPGVALVALGLGVLDREPVVVAGRAVLESEAAELDETLFLTAARAGRIVVLDKVEGTGFLRAAPRIGSEVPVHATAVGKLYLAHAREAVDLPKGQLRKFTASTRVRPRELAAEVDAAARRGWAENHEEWLAGLAVVAAPVFLGERMVAALALAASSARLTPARARTLGPRIARAGRTITARLEGKTQ